MGIFATACGVLGCSKMRPCPDHGPRAYDRARGSAHKRGYTSDRWRPAREAFLRAYPLCGDRPGGLAPVMSLCREQGLVVPGRQVDHVRPHRGDQRLFWDREGNWQTLCATCGARKSKAGL